MYKVQSIMYKEGKNLKVEREREKDEGRRMKDDKVRVGRRELSRSEIQESRFNTGEKMVQDFSLGPQTCSLQTA